MAKNLADRIKSAALVSGAIGLLALTGNCGVRMVQAYSAYRESDQQLNLATSASVMNIFDVALGKGRNYSKIRKVADEARKNADEASELAEYRFKQAFIPWYEM